MRHKIHLLAVAGTCRELPAALGCASVRELFALIQSAIGAAYQPAGSERLILAPENDRLAGRDDDAERARDLTRALADDAVAAIVALRGGNWLARILPRVDFDVLKRRRKPVTLFGFSELTSVLNIVATYPQARCLYDYGPAFLRGGMAAYARERVSDLVGSREWDATAIEAFSFGWANGQFRRSFCDFFAEVVSIIENHGSPRRVNGRLVAGKLPPKSTATFVGGNLACMLPLIGSRYAQAIDTPGRWLVIEDINEPPRRIDRMLASLQLAGLLERCSGVLVGDFRDDVGDVQPAALACLEQQMPNWGRVPIVTTRDIGHLWPMSPLPIGRPVTLVCNTRGRAKGAVGIEVPWQEWNS